VPRRLPRLLFCVLGLTLASGCTFFGERLRPARPTTAAELVSDMDARRKAVTSLRARMRLRSGLARMWTRQAVLVQRPAAIRIDVLSPFGLALALGTEGKTLWAFPPQQGVRYEGPASPANFARLLGTPLGVADLVDVLLGVAPARQTIGQPELEREGPDYVLTLRYQGGSQIVRFAADTLQMTRVEERRDGAPPIQVTFGDYRDGFARALDLVGDKGVTASIAFDEVEPNAAIDAGAFEPPAAPKVLPLERAAAPS
jgi:outer membrane lipoprotein-sorting protein